MLLVDADPESPVFLARFLSHLEGADLELETATDVSSGLAALESNRHAVCLVAHPLGSESGVEFIRTAIAAGCSVPLILLASEARTETNLAALEAGAADTLVKKELSAFRLEIALRYALE